MDAILRLYVAGASATARRAEKQLAGLQAQIGPELKIEVIDVQEKPELAEKAGILATPTLAYEHPERSRQIIGDLGDIKRVLEFLGLEPKEGSPHDHARGGGGGLRRSRSSEDRCECLR
ncbi:circadian clock KaiB family protein [Bradyrhizobium sp. ISRA435]|nr:circadian clock KaiB family protein [Bradyrhizobium sp. ISRA435]